MSTLSIPVILFTFTLLGVQAQDFTVKFSEPSLVESHANDVFIVKLKDKTVNAQNLYITSQADGSVYETIEFKFSGLSIIKSKVNLL